MTQKSLKKKTGKEALSVEDIYRNQNFTQPNQKTFETIFEEPRTSKDGEKQLTSVKKYKRFLEFDPTKGKIQKRRNKVKKYVKKSSLNSRKTRSMSPETIEDSSFHIPDISDDSIDSETSLLTSQVLQSHGQKDQIESHDKCSKIDKKEQSSLTALIITCCDSNVERNVLSTDNAPQQEERNFAKNEEESEMSSTHQEESTLSPDNSNESPRKSCIIT